MSIEIKSKEQRITCCTQRHRVLASPSSTQGCIKEPALGYRAPAVRFHQQKKVLAPAHCCVSSLWYRWEAEATLMLCLTKSLQFYNQEQNLDGKHFVRKEIPSHLGISRGDNIWKGEIPLFKRIPCRVFPALVQVLQLDKDT